jgi:hypothetical protein
MRLYWCRNANDTSAVEYLLATELPVVTVDEDGESFSVAPGAVVVQFARGDLVPQGLPMLEPGEMHRFDEWRRRP